ncbi:hypothetical protein DM02DRAFT_157847 [Periconia macrospinosa]|uniref:Uncharacterized protein n=1 Tax=Periconia macrospinosa TaxID=97972 RepID=A0A2V1ECE2_9PLEO|nr:hypothetical protein DM02DRAFT_157847 [Periconia macrospinosa]
MVHWINEACQTFCVPFTPFSSSLLSLEFLFSFSDTIFLYFFLYFFFLSYRPKTKSNVLTTSFLPLFPILCVYV